MKRGFLGKFSLYILSLFVVLSFTLPGEKSVEYSQSVELFNTIFKEINSYYVEDVDPEALVRVGIDAMLESLDPYTNYIPKEEISHFNSITTGEFYGIGASIGQVNGRNVVLMPLEGYPAHTNGLTRGDEIIEIDGVNVEGRSNEFISKLLKKDTRGNVKIKFKRYGVDDYLEKTLPIDRIKIKNVSYFGMIAEDIGYIKLDEFTHGASDEVRNAVLQLKSRNAEKFILDLRGNPGGLLNEAIQVANIFLPKGTPIVSIRGKAAKWNKTYNAYNMPIDTLSPLVALTNGNSASAAEIVAGALQDYDRALLIGQKTYGKGLVQATIPLSADSKLKITTAKFFIPSGRCIQKVDYNDNDTIREDKTYFTANHRAVKAADGIMPDIEIAVGDAPELIRELKEKGLIFDFASAYHHAHPQITSDPSQFELSDNDYDLFKMWIAEKEFDYFTDAEKSFRLFANISRVNDLYPEIADELNSITAKLSSHKNEAYEKYKKEITAALEEEIITRYYMNSGKIEVSMRHDRQIKSALNKLTNLNKYNALLKISTEI